jgi:excisionase family DNA binding protein
MDASTRLKMAWSLGEVASSTGLSVGFLRNEIRAGRLPGRKFGRRVLVRDDDLQSYLEKGSPGNTSEQTIRLTTRGKKELTGQEVAKQYR